MDNDQANTSTVEAQIRQHYHLVSGSVVIVISEDNVQALPVNALLITDDGQLNFHGMNKAQMALQATLANKLGDVPKVVDVILHSISHLGVFTPEEWSHVPGDLDIQERQNQGGFSAEEIKEDSEVVDFATGKPLQ